MLIERETTTAVSPEIRDRLIAETGGNPLALLELPSVLNEAQLSGAEPVLAPIPISTRVERAFLARVRRLPEQTQTMLLVAAAEDTGELATVLRAATRLGAPSGALDSAERAGLVLVRGSRLELRHPLVRSAVYQAAPFSKRQAAHHALAEVLAAEGDADRRVWHRAVASVEPDPEVVAELEHVAQRARRRSGFAAASLAFERAATLTTDDDLRARRLTLAAENAWLAGRVERAHVLLEGARPLVSDPIQRADIEANAGLIEMTRGVPAEASRLLLRAARDVGPIDADRAFKLLNGASLAAAYAGDDDAMIGIAAVARGLTLGDDPFRRMLAQLLIGIGAHTAGDFAEAARRLREARELAQRLEEATAADQPMALLFAGRVAIFLGDDDVAYRTHQEAAGRTRASGALSVLAQILTRLIVLEIFAGRLATAEATAREGIELARQTGNHDIAAQDLALLAVIAAARGSEDECRSLFNESRGLAAARGLGVVEAFADWAMVLLELGLGRADEALDRGRGISSTVVVCWSALDRIEAAIRVGERDTARAWLEPFARWAESSAALWARAVVLHCRALLTDDVNEAERLFLTALEAHAGAARPFERARSELAYGEFLRRDRRRVESREHLRTALDRFERLGAAPWAERARAELRASGQTARKRDSSTRDDLTAQELQIARFVSEGLTNREVAAQLFLSPRTVDFHLRNIFRKLGVTSRTALARLDLN
jgi:DNA-binding CsgD family transcriptional regulator